MAVHFEVEKFVRGKVAVNHDIITQHYRLVDIVVDCRDEFLRRGNVGRALVYARVNDAHAGNNAGGDQYDSDRNRDRQFLQSFSHNNYCLL